MKGGAGPGRKGHGFEREVATMICAAFGVSHDLCCRTPLSGGHRFLKKEDPGDLMIAPKMMRRFPFVVECKFEKDASLVPFFDREDERRKKETKWLDQVIDAANQANAKKGVFRAPMLVFKVQGAAFCATQSDYNPNPLTFSTIAYFQYHDMNWFLMRFDKFLEAWVNQEQEKAQKRRK